MSFKKIYLVGVLFLIAYMPYAYSCPGGRDRKVVKGAKSAKVISDPLLIHGNQVEKVKLGNSMKEILSLYPTSRIERVLIYDGKGSYEKIEILNHDRSEVLFSVEPDCSSTDSACIVKRISVTSNSYHTIKNIHIGEYYISLIKAGEKFKAPVWFEGNLILRAAETGVNYVLETNLIPKPWYETMDKETLPDSTKIIGILLTGKNLKGISYDEVDSINRRIKADLAIKKAIATKMKLSHLENKRTSHAKLKAESSVQQGLDLPIMTSRVEEKTGIRLLPVSEPETLLIDATPDSIKIKHAVDSVQKSN